MLKNLNYFNRFDIEGFLAGKGLVFLKAEPWKEYNDEGRAVRQLGSKVSALIVRDDTDYGDAEYDNFGETLLIKVSGLDPSAFAKLTPLQTEIAVGEVKRASTYGDYNNMLSITAAIEIVK